METVTKCRRWNYAVTVVIFDPSINRRQRDRTKGTLVPHTRTTLTAIGINPPQTVNGTWHHRQPRKGERFIGFGGLMTALHDLRSAHWVLDEPPTPTGEPTIDTHRCDAGNGRHWLTDGTIG